MAARQIALAVLLSLMSISPAFAQTAAVGETDGVFTRWESNEDMFGANFPGTPVKTDITWETEYGAKIPGHVYMATLPGPRIFSVTVVDYSPVQAILSERAKGCLEDERCSGNTSYSGLGYWKNDLRGAMIYAASNYLKRDITFGHYMWNYLGFGVEVNELQFVSNKDKSRTHVTIYMYHNRLYVMEDTAPGNYPPPGLFAQSISLKDPEGTPRHTGVYFNGPQVEPNEQSLRNGVPAPAGGGRGAGPAGGRGAGPGAAAPGGN